MKCATVQKSQLQKKKILTNVQYVECKYNANVKKNYNIQQYEINVIETWIKTLKWTGRKEND